MPIEKESKNTVPCSACGGTGRIRIRQKTINEPPIEPPATEEQVAAHMKKIRAAFGKLRMPKTGSTRRDDHGLTKEEYREFKERYLKTNPNRESTKTLTKHL